MKKNVDISEFRLDQPEYKLSVFNSLNAVQLISQRAQNNAGACGLNI